MQEGIFVLIHLFTKDILVMKKLEIQKTKPTTFNGLDLFSWISNFFTNKTSLANECMSFSSSNSALICSL